MPLGDYTSAQGRALAALSEQLGNGTLRTTNEQNVVLPFVSGASLPALYHRLEEIGLAEPCANHLSDVVSCPGADYCSLAITRSMGMAGSASAMFSRTERLNSTFSCRTTPIWRRSHAGSAMARSMPSIRTRPLSGT